MAAGPPSELSDALEHAGFTLLERLGAGATSEVWRAIPSDGATASVVLKIGREPAMASILAGEALVSSLALSPRLPELVTLGTLSAEAATSREGSTVTTALSGLPFVAFADRGAGEVRLDGASTELALTLARDVGEALADLHAVGIAHGDIKLANVLMAGSQAMLIDLGLAGPAHQTEVHGATPRYLARSDRRLGDALARDLLALGLLLAETSSEEVRTSLEPLAVARNAQLPEAIAPLCAALLAPEPGARPSAAWVHEVAKDKLAPELSAAHFGRRVRAAYLRLRRHELASALSCTDDVAAWAASSVLHHHRARAMCRAAGVAPPPPLDVPARLELAPLSPADRRRWLVSLVGSAALSWPMRAVAQLPENELALALTHLAAERRPEVWTLHDVEHALAGAPGRVSAAPHPSPFSRDPTPKRRLGLAASQIAELALRVSRIPPDWTALGAVERDATAAPAALVLAAADTLRLAGQLGRAHSLVVAARLDEARGRDVVADILRRCGDTTRATALAQRAMADGEDPHGRAAAALARIHYDAGELTEARRVLGPTPSHAATLEVSALLASAQGDTATAVAHAERGLALAISAEAKARLLATLAFVERGGAGEVAHQRFQRAAEHAVQAGAVLEEASYRTGEAAAAVDRGAIEAAIEAAERAALLWEEVLDRPSMAARAWLARGAAFATIDMTHEARQAAHAAIVRAEESGDAQAQAYAWWVIADVSEPGSRDGRDAAARAHELLPDGGEEALQAHARVLLHDPDALGDALTQSLDDRCRHSATQLAEVPARLAWWGARAHSLRLAGIDAKSRDDGQRVVSELCALAGEAAPVDTLGRALFAGAQLAATLGLSDALVRLETGREAAAARVLDGTRHHLAAAARACAWLSRHQQAPTLDPERAIDLRQLVLALSERDDLQALLDRVLDVLIMWTGAERGLLLMHTDDGALVPHAARNLGRADLREEQLQVSQSLAERALASGEPVVAIDAMEELSSSYDSVHALKLRSVLALPLIAQGEVLGVVYLDDRLRRGAFGDKELSWAQSVAPVAALAIADARAQGKLKRAVREAERVTAKLEETLARKESALDLAERELRRSAPSDARQGQHANIIGTSAVMTKLLALTDRVAASDVPVLLLGESGSGKELIARAVHRASPRSERAFVGENCGALPETLLESALFGHVKGAFTGAHRARVGLFEAADEGTLFLDEIGEMSLGMQTKLLRVLEDNLVRPVGATQSRKVDVRVLAATHRDLESMVARGSFREDLYYRLNVIALRVPALRERPSDIPLLVEHLIQKHAAGRSVRVAENALRKLSSFSWPGNVRQLENEVRRALLLADNTIEPQHLSIGDDAGPALHGELGLNLRKRIDQLEVDLVGEAMQETNGNQTRAAKLLGVSRFGLHKMIKRLGIPAHKRETD